MRSVTAIDAALVEEAHAEALAERPHRVIDALIERRAPVLGWQAGVVDGDSPVRLEATRWACEQTDDANVRRRLIEALGCVLDARITAHETTEAA